MAFVRGKGQRLSIYLWIESSASTARRPLSSGAVEEILPFSRRDVWQSGVRAMFSVIFEVHPRREKFDLYLGLAKGLKTILEGIDGFIDHERFKVSGRPGWA